MLSKALKKSSLSVKNKAVATICAIVLAVTLPQIFHSLGNIFGLGTSVGEIFLPMHLPVLTVGFLAGPAAGALCGLLAPVISFALSGMPGSLMLPIIAIELFTYGLVSGLCSNKNSPVFTSLIITQFAGRAMRALATVSAVYLFGSTVTISTIWMSLITGIVGILIQWAIIPVFVTRINSKK